ncbi:hypothetical protein FHS25_006202 [Rhizobium laguerreae]|uniref:Uncharacterized protein n=1 Tax=Rhizobium laguerreae TaxID=1076926 RepID=A0ABR6GHB4_9HYPH|nr:hypothetical protein [Rhizobium laguerreae]MBB3165690.1 hypothetical protein [Rhizobium laguerreae]
MIQIKVSVPWLFLEAPALARGRSAESFKLERLSKDLPILGDEVDDVFAHEHFPNCMTVTRDGERIRSKGITGSFNWVAMPPSASSARC